MLLLSQPRFTPPAAGLEVPGTPPPATFDAPKPRGPSPRRHNNIHMDIEQERGHLQEHVKEEYIDPKQMDDNQLLMTYFKKYDTDDNKKLDGLELLEAIRRMDGKIMISVFIFTITEKAPTRAFSWLK